MTLKVSLKRFNQSHFFIFNLAVCLVVILNKRCIIKYDILYVPGGNMARQIIVSSKLELENYRKTITDNVEKNIIELKKILDNQAPLDVFCKMKFDKIAIEPISGKEENIIEVINQLQTYMISIMAVEYLLTEYPNKSFIILSLTVEKNKKPRKPSIYAGCEAFILRFEIWYFILVLCFFFEYFSCLFL